MPSKAALTGIVMTVVAVLIALFIANMVNKNQENAPLRP